MSKLEIYTDSLEGAFRKGRQLAREIEERRGWIDLDHSASKLMIFLSEMVPDHLRKKWDDKERG